MAAAVSRNSVKAWDEVVHIPTYPAPAADKNPMFLEKRVYQGSSGKVYPNAFTDRVSDEKRDQPYRAVFLENDFVQVMILPEIGGRIHRGLDKTNNYDFFYHQHVVKPALVGLLGPWISGGVEFNWPQHHRPSTFMAVDHRIEQHPDGSATVWLSEHEPMDRMKGMAGIRLYPDRSLVEVCAQLYNRTPFVHTFLWWANVGVHVHNQYEAFFPPDVTYVADHAKRAMSEFPVARGFYYGVDYTPGVDIRWYKNIPVPTSYMAMDSKFDFAGGYDHERQAGVIHVADHHISPGKKLWTWGNHEFGYAWDRELTDSDGPYDELMAGVYTDNQPDFSFLHPYETRTFRQAWYPIQGIGPANNANRDVAVSLEVDGNRARMGVCVSRANLEGVIVLSDGVKLFLERKATLSPGKPFMESVELPSGVAETDLLLVVRDGHRELIRYKRERYEKKVPAPATEPKLPHEIASSDELYVVGLHLEQYRHATRKPEPYWEEAVRRDGGDARCNNALGMLRLRRGDFAGAEQYFRRAIARLTERNPNPYDGEPLYNLGLTLKFMGRFQDAYAAFVKSTWNYAWQSAAQYGLAQIHCIWREYDAALDQLDRSLETNLRHSNGRNLKSAVLRRLNRFEDAERTAAETAAMDPLDFWSRNEILLTRLARGQLEAAKQARDELADLTRGAVQTYLDVAYDYAAAGFVEDASDVLERIVAAGSNHPLALYSLGAFAQHLGNHDGANAVFRRAAAASPDYCFPARLEEMLVLKAAVKANPADARAHYYLGNLLYDKQRYDEAIEHWERSCELDASFSIPFRNLGIAYYNIRHDADRAHDAYEKAFTANSSDARLLYEVDQLQKRMNASAADRLNRLQQYPQLVAHRDDLTVELVTLYNHTGQPEKALDVLLARRFHPWEGGEGLVSAQYVWAHIMLGNAAMATGNFNQALQHFEAAKHYPHNLGEGKHLLTPENHLHYLAGVARKGLGDNEGARREFEQATQVQPVFSSMTYYRALAYRELGNEKKCQELMDDLASAADEKLNLEVKIDYFATSLPNFLLFDDDLQKRNRIECLYLKGLAERGLGLRDEAERSMREVQALDVSHLAAEYELRQLRSMPARARS